ncbi:hypothetical protein Thiowin_04004 [Thiorhodovibrio winogradskyi]|uniref:Transposase n=1 Tax=Thiorhodovibrio winogradskyi TaxID=77007 RepID=A0ABZ0SEG4_9GAMM|nr:hypothetical protein [Thiorhodovibrio winogradskyi]
MNQAVLLEVLIDIEGVEVFGVEAGQEYIDDDGQVDFVAVWSWLLCWRLEGDQLRAEPVGRK